MKPRGPKESELVAAAGARLVAGYARPCFEARSCAQSGTQSCILAVHNLWDAWVPMRVPNFSHDLTSFAGGGQEFRFFSFLESRG